MDVRPPAFVNGRERACSFACVHGEFRVQAASGSARHHIANLSRDPNFVSIAGLEPIMKPGLRWGLKPSDGAAGMAAARLARWAAQTPPSWTWCLVGRSRCGACSTTSPGPYLAGGTQYVHP